MKNIENYIEYTNLKVNLRSKEVKEVVERAIQHNYRAVVLTYNNVSLAKDLISKKGASTKVVTVYGFPSDGYSGHILKEYSPFYDELDVVVPIKAYYYMDPPQVEIVRGILSLVKAQLGDTKKIKLIIETALMVNKENRIKELCSLAKEGGVDVIKTNTGLFQRKSFEDLVEDIKLIKKYWKKEIKASGGIHSMEEVKKLLSLGVNYIGTSKDIIGENNA